MLQGGAFCASFDTLCQDVDFESSAKLCDARDDLLRTGMLIDVARQGTVELDELQAVQLGKERQPGEGRA